MILDKKVFVARLSPDSSDNDKEAYVELSTLAGVPMNIQPADSELVAVTDGSFGRSYRAFTTVSGIQIGDRITVSGSNETFTVKGKSDWYILPIPHLELVLYKGDN